MKRVFAILTASLLLISGIQISIDRHYCGGKLVDIKLSVSGRLASCGMEENTGTCSTNATIDRKCCEDQVTFYTIAGKYLPESLRISYPVISKDLPSVPVREYHFSQINSIDPGSWVLPPGDPLGSLPDLSLICVYRI